MNRTTVTFPVILLGLLLFPALGQAQIRLIPQVGLYASVSDLGTVDTPEGVKDVGKQGTSLAYGLSLDLSSARILGFRITGLYGSKSEIPVDGIGCTAGACDLRSTMLGLSAGVVVRAFPAGWPFRPYFLVEAGAKHYNFDFDSDSPLKDAFGDETQAAGVLGAGFDWNLGILRGNLELADYISGSFLDGGKKQHDFFLTVGLVLG